MKWIALILLLANVMSYLYGLKQVASKTGQVAKQHESLGAKDMTVIKPNKKSMASQSLAPASAVLNEVPLAQLNIDEKGKVLRQIKPKEQDIRVKPLKKIQMDETLGSVLVLPKPVVLEKEKGEQKSNPAEPVLTTRAPVNSVKVSPAQPTCLTFGPFKDQQTLTKVQRAFELNETDYELVTLGKKNKIKAVRIFMGPFSSTAARKAQRKILNEDKIDHFVVSIDGTPLIQLGYFSDAKRAKNYQQRLKNRNIEAKAALIYSQTSKNTLFKVAKITRKLLETQLKSAKVTLPIKVCS